MPSPDEATVREVPGADRRLVLTYTLIERYYVTDEALAAIGTYPDASQRDDALIELFECHQGSAYVERFFYHDANPSVGCEITEENLDD